MEKLYEANAYLKQFTATVLSCEEGKKSFDVVLDQTAFYPEGGGQPYDTGILGGAEVLEVHERGGHIIHTCKQALEVGSTGEGTINWERRFDLMQNHSGEHIVSGMAHNKWGCDNVGFHMGSDLITIDLNILLSEEQLKDLETDVNRYIQEDHPVVITFPSPKEWDALEYRSKKELTGQVRIVSFPGADTCACCGTHVSTSGQIGLVKLLTVQKFREGVRIELVCGNRAFRYLDRALEQNHQISNLLSAKVFETGAAVRRLLGENEALKARIQAMEEVRFAALAETYADKGDVVFFEDGLTPDGVRRACVAVMERCGGRCVCLSGKDGEGYKYAIGHKGGNLKELTKMLNQTLNGRGGGKPDFVQGSVAANRTNIEAFFASN